MLGNLTSDLREWVLHSCMHCFKNLGGSALKSGAQFSSKSSLAGCKGGWKVIKLFLEEMNLGCGILDYLSLALLKELIKFVNTIICLGLERGQGLSILLVERCKMIVLCLQHGHHFKNVLSRARRGIESAGGGVDAGVGAGAGLVSSCS